MGVSPASITTTPWMENTQAIMTVPPRTAVSRPDSGLPSEQMHAHQEG
jgi:hypothetical protein